MISARISRHPASPAAVLVRVAAFLVAVISVIVIPFAVAAAVFGRTSVPEACIVAAVAAGLTLLTGLAARSLDPLRR